MTEKIISKISENYAKALFETALDKGTTDIIAQQLSEILNMISSSQDLKVVLTNTSISSVKKVEIIDTILSDKINKELLNFLKILAEKNRINELESIKASYLTMLDRQENKKNVEIISPIELSSENKSNILFKLEQKLKSEIKPVWTTDKSIIAGLVFKFDDCIIDTSVRKKLNDLNKR